MKKNKVNPPKVYERVETLVRGFAFRLESTSDSFPLFQNLLKEERKKQEDFVKKTLKGRVKRNRKKINIQIKHPQEWLALLETSRKIAKINSIYRDFPDSVLMLLVTEVEDYFSRLLKIALEVKPEILSSSKTLTYEEILKNKSIASIKNRLVEREVNQLIKDGIEKLFEWLNNSPLKIDIRNYTSKYPDFLEIFQRRHLFVHNEGYIDDEYITKIKKYGLNGADIKKGKKLRADETYISNAFDVLTEVGAIIGFCIMIKLEPNEEKRHAQIISDFNYEMLRLNKNKLALSMLAYNLKLTSRLHLRKESQTICQINMALAHLQSGSNLESKKIAKKILEQKPEERYEMAANVLLSRYQKAIKLLLKLGKKIGKESYHKWPLFRKMRYREDFQNVYKKIYKEKYIYKPVEKYLT